MIEIWSRELTASELLTAIERFRRLKGFRESTDDEGIMEFRWEELCPLALYRLVPGSRVRVAHEGADAESLPELCALAEAGQNPRAKRIVTLELDIAESGVFYDAKKLSDLCWGFSLSSLGFTIRVGIGEASRGYSSIPARLEIFKKAFGLLGLESEIALSLSHGKLRLTVTGNRAKLHAFGSPLPHPPYVAVDVAGLDGTNFLDVRLVGLICPEEFRRVVASVAAGYQDREIRAVSLIFSCEPDDYDALREYLAGKKREWLVRLHVENPFRLADLERLLATTREFDFYAFSLRLKRVGLIHVELSGYGDRYRMRFVPESPDPAIEEFAVPILDELSGLGPGFLEREA